LIGRRIRSNPGEERLAGGQIELFLVRQIGGPVWEALVHPGRRLFPGARMEFDGGSMTAEVIEWRESGRRLVRFETAHDFDQLVDRIGRTPLPPYIKRDEEHPLDSERYQTVFARQRGAV